MNFKFDVTATEAETMLNALAQGPFAQVHQLIAKLQQQAQAQMAQAAPTQNPTEEIRHE